MAHDFTTPPATSPVPGPIDAMTAAPDEHDLLIENESVRVLDTKLAPGERTPVHTHQWPSVLYVLSWSDFERYDPDGNLIAESRSWSKKPEAGSAIWAAPLRPHYVKNVGDGELHLVAVEVKPR